MSNTSTPTVTASVLIIGDEILSGRTADTNTGTIARFCNESGIDLGEVRIVADIVDDIVDAVNALRARYTYVFTTGGIGPTHDDITADCIAKAFDVELEENESALVMMGKRFGHSTSLTQARRRMARIPEGASLIANPVSGAPGFRIDNVFVMAGVPKIMEIMLESIAPMLEGGQKWFSRTIQCGVGESAIAASLSQLQAEYEQVKIGSYPRMGEKPVFTEVVLRARDQQVLDEAAQKVQTAIDKAHAKFDVDMPKR